MISSAGKPIRVFDFLGDRIGAGRGKIDLVDDRDDLKVLVERQIHIGERLRLDPLTGIHDEHRTFARLQRAADFIGEIDMTGSIDQIDLVVFAIFRRIGHTDGGRFDRHTAFTLQVHAIQQLLLHVTVCHGVCEL